MGDLSVPSVIKSTISLLQRAVFQSESACWSVQPDKKIIVCRTNFHGKAEVDVGWCTRFMGDFFPRNVFFARNEINFNIHQWCSYVWWWDDQFLSARTRSPLLASSGHLPCHWNLFSFSHGPLIPHDWIGRLPYLSIHSCCSVLHAYYGVSFNIGMQRYHSHVHMCMSNFYVILAFEDCMMCSK